MTKSESVEARALRWAGEGDVGISSKAIMRMMTGNEQRDWYCYPLDPQDFARCLALLDMIPEWRPRLGEMAKVGPEWAALVEHWDEIEAIHRQGNYAVTYKKIKTILNPIEGRRPDIVKIAPGVSIRFNARAK